MLGRRFHARRASRNGGNNGDPEPCARRAAGECGRRLSALSVVRLLRQRQGELLLLQLRAVSGGHQRRWRHVHAESLVRCLWLPLLVRRCAARAVAPALTAFRVSRRLPAQRAPQHVGNRKRLHAMLESLISEASKTPGSLREHADQSVWARDRTTPRCISYETDLRPQAMPPGSEIDVAH